MESLENRQLLTTLNGGDTFIYKDSNDDLFRITLIGNVQAEFVGAAVSDTNVVTLGDLVPWFDDDTDGRDLFAIYVGTADWDSVITIEQVDVDTNNGQITPNPFNGNIDLNVTNARNGMNLTMNTNGGSGMGFLGARTNQINGVNNSENRPILTANLPGQIGILPTDSGPWLAGLIVADGQDLGKFLFDGTITGNVDVGGSMNLFYAGNILTGDTGGSFVSSFPAQNPDNFNIDGDLRDLVISGSVGTDNTGNLGPGDDPLYITRVQMRIGGHLGQIHVGDAFVASLQANDLNQQFHNEPQLEIESRGTFTTYAEGFLNDTLGNGDDQFHNDTFDTAQYLGTLQGGILVQGELDALDRDNFRDWADYYAVPLLAGQSVTVQLTDTTFLGFPGGPAASLVNLINIGVYDPDGRLIATDYSDVDRFNMAGQPFTFTAQRPGIYRFAVGEITDADFNGPIGEFIPVGHIGFATYDLSIQGAGDLAIGGIVTGNNLLDAELGEDGLVAHNGDFGAIATGGNAIFLSKLFLIGPGPGPTPVWNVRTLDGSLRAIVGAQIGRFFANAAFEGPDLSINNGDVGLLRSTTGVLSVNETLMLDTITDPTIVLPQPDLPRNYQMVDAATRFEGALVADQKIGMVLAGNMASLAPSVFHANADNFGDDGVIDLIDVRGNFGTLQAGGPHITTGPKGNVRFINVEGILFRDEAFGGGQPDLTVFNPGQAATITDDSGAIIKISPANGGTLGVLTYGIRGSGGSATVRVETTSAVNIKSNTRKNTSPAEIGMILATGDQGRGVVLLPSGNIGLDPTYFGPDYNVDVNGKARVDLYKVIGGRFTRIQNNTPGEIVTTMAGSIGTIRAQNLGTPKHSTPAVLVGRDVLVQGAVYPYLDQTTGILASDIVQVISPGQVGNIIVSAALVAAADPLVDPRVTFPVGGTSSIRTVTADTDGKRAAGSFDGITGPVYAEDPTGAPLTGRINEVNIGAGIMPSGSGNMAKAGIFASGRIGTVRGKKTANIRGNVVSEDSIGRIDLVNGGSIINANIMVPAELSDARDIDTFRVSAGDADSVDNPTFELGQITLTGDAKGKVNPRRPKPIFRGGIIGSYFSGSDIGSTILKAGSFGIINSVYATPGNGVINKFQTDGYGLRNVVILAGARIGDIIAQGSGQSISTAVFSEDVRQSETQTIDPFFETAPTPLTDLHKFLGTSKVVPTLAGITDAGIIAGVSALASRDLNSLVAWKLVGNTNDDPAVFNFANRIKKIQIAEDIFDVSIITGQLDTFKVGHDVINLDMTVAGTIGLISIGHDYDANSRIRAIGPDGTIDSIFVGHDLDGDMSAENSVLKLRVDGLYNGDVTANGVRVLET
jgi:hypothetical protein